ncbi:MAG: LON peptidase substrate-binding domain-containing protein [Caulobacteraceae bacterium]
MRDYRDAKAMARRLREALAQKGLALTHTDCLELIARAFGLKDWNVLASMLEAGGPPDAGPEPPEAVWSGPALLLRDIVMFPRQTAPLFVGREMSKRALTHAWSGEQEVFLVAQKNREDDAPGADAIYGVGVIADILEQAVLSSGEVKLLVRGRERARLVRLLDDNGFRRADVAQEGQARRSDPRADTLMPAVREAIAARLSKDGPSRRLDGARLAEIAHPGVLADFVAGLAPLSIADKQSLLEIPEPSGRLERLLALLAHAEAA